MSHPPASIHCATLSHASGSARRHCCNRPAKVLDWSGMGVRYIGSKARIAEAIVDLAGQPTSGRFVDAFSGTGSVAAAAAERGWRISVNDALPSAVSMSVASLLSPADVPFESLGGYAAMVDQLNSLPGEKGFIHREYTPASASHAGVERRYFTEANGARLDAMRRRIALWRKQSALTDAEHHLALSDLMQAANSVANISGTYGGFLKQWTPGSERRILVKPRKLANYSSDYISSVGDVAHVETTGSDVVYFDPPYTKRQYSAYYHLLETIHAGDSPQVDGVTGLRPWRDKASDFSYRTKALAALTHLVATTTADRILLSYSDEGHVPMQQLIGSLSEHGDITVHSLEIIGRYRPNSKASAARDNVREYVIELRPVSQKHSISLGATEVMSV